MATALDLYEPFDAGAGANVAEDNWRKMARHWMESGVLSGEDNELQVYADSTGLQVKAKTGKTFVRGHYGENTSEKILPIAANASGSTRIDRVVLRADFTNNRVDLDVIQGTPGGAAPAVTQNAAMWEIPLAQVSIPTGDASIDAGQVTDERDALWLFGTRNVAFRAYTPTWYGNAGASAYTLGNGVVSGSWRRDGRRITGRAKLVLGSTTTFPAGGLAVALPVPSGGVAAGDVCRGRLKIIDSSAGNAKFYRETVFNIGLAQIVFDDVAGVTVTTNGVPITLAVGDTLSVAFDYESAT